MPRPDLPDPATAEPRLVAVLRAFVADCATVRVRLDDLRAAAIESDSSMATAGEGRRRLAAALSALEAAQAVVLPKGDACWDRGRRLRLPLWIDRVNAVSQRPPPSEFPPEVLAMVPAAAHLSRPKPSEVVTLRAVARWLATGGASRPVVPSRERSLELFGRPMPGDPPLKEPEKRLDSLARTRLFSLGVLSYPMLRAEPIPVPLTSVWVPPTAPGDVLCVVAENHHTWVSLVRAAAASSHGGVHVCWGAGDQFKVSVASIPALDPPIRTVHYFGDLDLGGLAVPVDAQAVIPAPVIPAAGLYRRLLASPLRETISPVPAERATAATAWLGPSLARAAATLLAAGVRVAQEAVGTDVLRGTAPGEWVC